MGFYISSKNTLSERILQAKTENYIYSWFSDEALFRDIVEKISQPFKNQGITKVVGLESRGFILAAPIAYRLSVGFVAARKSGKMFRQSYGGVFSRSYIDYSKQEKGLEIENNAAIISSDDVVLVVDDWIETLNSMKVVIDMLENDVSCTVNGIGTVLDDSDGRSLEIFKDYNVVALAKGW